MNSQITLTRKERSFYLRIAAAQKAFNSAPVTHKNNGDDEDGKAFPFWGNFTKGLPHDVATGEVAKGAYEALLKALESGADDDFNKIPGIDNTDMKLILRNLINPQAGLAFDLEGADGVSVTCPPAPSFTSARAAGEAVELYWMALLRDVAFEDYESNFKGGGMVKKAIDDLNMLPEFHGPRKDGLVTTQTLFRGTIKDNNVGDDLSNIANGNIIGPYISQFLLLPIPFGTLDIEQKQITVLGKSNSKRLKADYMTAWEEFIEVQNGIDKKGDLLELDEKGFPVKRFIRNGRDLSCYVHFDALYEAYLNACLILLGMGGKNIFDEKIPYLNSKRQDGFATFGGPHILTLVTEVATRALKAVWYQKWFVHRRLRPEAYGGLVHRYLTGDSNLPLDERTLKHSGLTVFDEVNRYNKSINGTEENSFLMPMAFPEGSPMHPAYGAGHATVAAACTTVLKAWFKEDAKIKDLKICKGVDAEKREILFNLPGVQNRESLGKAKVPDKDGFHLIDYTGPDNDDLTIGGELNKIAANIAVGRNHAGVHWYTDYEASLLLGEQIAMSILEEQKATYNEINGFSFINFAGEKVEI